jgi:DNA-binding IclR family transcriptional regulator
MKTEKKSLWDTRATDEKAYRRYRIPSLERVFELLETLAKHPHGMTFTELIDGLKIPKSGAFRMLTTLMHLQYLTKDEVSGKITMTRKILALGNTSICQYNLIEEALPFMRQLRDETGETVQINTHLGAEGVVVDSVPSIHEVRIVVDQGARFGLHCSAPGKVILAWMPEPERERILAAMTFPRHTEATITDRMLFRKELEKVRKQGFGVDHAEGIVVGLNCVSCPILNHVNYPIAAMTVVAPSLRLPESLFSNAAKHIKPLALALSKRLGYDALDTNAAIK